MNARRVLRKPLDLATIQWPKAAKGKKYLIHTTNQTPSPGQKAGVRRLRAYPRTVGDCPDFAESSKQNGTVPFSETVFG